MEERSPVEQHEAAEEGPRGLKGPPTGGTHAVHSQDETENVRKPQGGRRNI